MRLDSKNNYALERSRTVSFSFPLSNYPPSGSIANKGEISSLPKKGLPQIFMAASFFSVKINGRLPFYLKIMCKKTGIGFNNHQVKTCFQRGVYRYLVTNYFLRIKNPAAQI